MLAAERRWERYCTYGRRFSASLRKEVAAMEYISLVFHFRGYSFRFVLKKLKNRHQAR